MSFRRSFYHVHSVQDGDREVMEPFSFAKFFAGFGSAVGWVKAAAIAIRIAVIVCVPASFMWTYHVGKKNGTDAGYKSGYSQAIKDHPPITINGNNAQVNNNVEEKRGFQACVWPLRLGW